MDNKDNNLVEELRTGLEELMGFLGEELNFSSDALEDDETE